MFICSDNMRRLIFSSNINRVYALVIIYTFTQGIRPVCFVTHIKLCVILFKTQILLYHLLHDKSDETKRSYKLHSNRLYMCQWSINMCIWILPKHGQWHKHMYMRFLILLFMSYFSNMNVGVMDLFFLFTFIVWCNQDA